MRKWPELRGIPFDKVDSVRVTFRSAAAAGLGLALTVGTLVSATGMGAAGASTPAPLTRTLTASLHFTARSYRPGALAHIDVRLTNSGSTRLQGIGAACNRAGEPNEVMNRTSSWGALELNGRGVTLPAHSTQIYHVTATIPAAAQRAGSVGVVCDFGYRGVDTGYRATARDSARVPGQSGTLEGAVDYSVGTRGATAGLRNVRLVLVDRSVCPIVILKATTNTIGHFRIASAPAGANYSLYVLPPAGWKVIGGNPTPVMVLGRTTSRAFVQVQRGSAHTPRVPTTC